MKPIPTGRVEAPDWVVLTRTFRATIADVWAAVTEPGRLERWVGTWSGDPAEGRVRFRMTAEGADAPEETFIIEACEPPRLLRLASTDSQGTTWHLRLTLTEDVGTTMLHFAQRMTDPETASNVGPGWEYYLDRLVAAETGAGVGAIDWDAYYPAQSAYYRALLG